MKTTSGVWAERIRSAFEENRREYAAKRADDLFHCADCNALITQEDDSLCFGCANRRDDAEWIQGEIDALRANDLGVW